jgi:mono/diheme cytochrome c family protein
MKLALAALALLTTVLGGATAFVYSGLYDVSASDQHLALTYRAIRKTMERSVERRAKGISVPPLGAAEQIERGLGLFRTHCVQCHGAPGVAPEPFALGLTPLATPLQRSGLERTPAELYWMVKHGMKMTAMPAWEFRMSEDELWAVVAFVQRLPHYSVPEYRALRSGSDRQAAVNTEAPNPGRGKRALKDYGCIGCHEIPGQVGPEARLGPTLHGIGARATLAGVLPNTSENLARWLRDPEAHAKGTAMPNLGVSERDARDIAAYLAMLK